MSNSSCVQLLLVDDDLLQARYLLHVLRDRLPERFQLHLVTDPRTALERVEATGVDLLVTDLDMPEIDGLALLRAAKLRNSAVQTIMLTAASTSEALLEALDLGAADYLLKPVDPALLVALVEQAEQRLQRWRTALLGTFGRRHKDPAPAEATAGTSGH